MLNRTVINPTVKEKFSGHYMMDIRTRTPQMEHGFISMKTRTCMTELYSKQIKQYSVAK
jgi:hypothetical protein